MWDIRWMVRSGVEAVINRTEPSPSTTFTPPLWSDDHGMLFPVFSPVPFPSLLSNPRRLISHRVVVQLKVRSLPSAAPAPLCPALIIHACGPWPVGLDDVV